MLRISPLRNSPVLRIFALASVLIALLIYSTQNTKASIYAGAQAGWLMISSHSFEQDAINQARQYARNFPSVVVFSSTNGYFGVSVGWVSSQRGRIITSQLKAAGYIPGDAYVSKGERWVQAVWSASNGHLGDRRALLNATRLIAPGINQPQPKPTPYQVTSVAPTSAMVGGLAASGDRYLSLRRGPNTSYAEIVRMRNETRLTITGKSQSWYRVKLSNGMTGFAHSRYVKLVEVPTVGPDKNTGDEVPIIGPDPKKKKDTQIVVKSKRDKEPEKLPRKTRTDKDDEIQLEDQKKVALVLGNSAYENTAQLANPKNDADSIGSMLEKLGFKVVKGLDLTKAGMELSIREFVRELPGADVALFFYAGHAIQVNGTNYLIPIDAALEDSTAIDFETINFNVILNFMNESERTSIALLDACRNNPLARNFSRKLGKSRSAFVGRGLAAPTTGEGQLLISFATSPGEVALDGEGKNSPFTAALLEHMETPGLEIELMLKRVKADVFAETEGSQSPWNNSALRKEFYFAR